MYVPHAWTVPLKARNGHQSFWYQTSRMWMMSCECLELNPGPLGAFNHSALLNVMHVYLYTITCIYLLFFFLFLLDIFFIYISNVIPFPGFPSKNPLSPPCLPYSPTHPLLLLGPGIPLHWGIEPSQNQAPGVFCLFVCFLISPLIQKLKVC